MSKILCITCNGMKTTNSNGRSLMNLFYNVKKEDLLVFYTSNDISDYENCSSYYRVTDNEIIKTLLGKKVGRIVSSKETNKEKTGNIYKYSKNNRRNPVIRYIRQKLWGLNLWQNREFWKWIDDFTPDVILLYSGNNAFLDKIAWQISDRYSIPIVLFNCENYYLQKLKFNSFFGKLNRNFCDRIFEKTMSKAKGIIYNTDKLKNAYDIIFPKTNSIVCYQPASNFKISKNKNNQISYLGNISDYRLPGLIEISNILKEKGEKLHLYGGCKKDVEEKIKSEDNIIYYGLVSYEECCKAMTESKLLVHCDSMNDINNQFAFAFSTKVGDSLASGVPFFVYGPKNCAVTEYLTDKNCAFVCTDKNELKEKLFEALDNETLREKKVKTALKIADENHNIEKNSKKFLNFINEIIKNN